MGYRLKWEIDIDGSEASSPEEAAVKALEIQRDPSSWATVFEVTDDAGVTTTVDLGETQIGDPLNKHIFCITEDDVDTVLSELRADDNNLITLSPEQRQAVIEKIRNCDFSSHQEDIEGIAFRIAMSEGEKSEGNNT